MLGIDLYHIIIIRIAPKVRCCIPCLRPLLALKQTPVHAIEIEVIVAAPGIGITHITLGIPGENLP